MDLQSMSGRVADASQYTGQKSKGGDDGNDMEHQSSAGTRPAMQVKNVPNDDDVDQVADQMDTSDDDYSSNTDSPAAATLAPSRSCPFGVPAACDDDSDSSYVREPPTEGDLTDSEQAPELNRARSPDHQHASVSHIVSTGDLGQASTSTTVVCETTGANGDDAGRAPYEPLHEAVSAGTLRDTRKNDESDDDGVEQDAAPMDTTGDDSSSNTDSDHEESYSPAQSRDSWPGPSGVAAACDDDRYSSYVAETPTEGDLADSEQAPELNPARSPVAHRDHQHQSHSYHGSMMMGVVGPTSTSTTASGSAEPDSPTLQCMMTSSAPPDQLASPVSTPDVPHASRSVRGEPTGHRELHPSRARLAEAVCQGTDPGYMGGQPSCPTLRYAYACLGSVSSWRSCFLRVIPHKWKTKLM